MDEENSPWLNVFTIGTYTFDPLLFLYSSLRSYSHLDIVFEMVSAFGGIGLTLGIPDQNYALSGAFSPVSKLVICIIVSSSTLMTHRARLTRSFITMKMLRGRHRGLPVAIDRASTPFPSLPSFYVVCH